MAKRGRKPLATATKETRGAFVKDPQRKNHDEPQVVHKRPDPTEAVKSRPIALAKWHHCCDLLEGMKILSTADRDLLEQYCLVYDRIQTCESMLESEGEVIMGSKDQPCRNPRMVVLSTLQNQQLKILSELGLTPSSRTQLKASPDSFADAFEKFMKRTESLN